MRITGLLVFKDEAKYFLKESVQAALATCDDVIAVDTGSVDDGPDMLAKLDSRVTVLRMPQEGVLNKSYGDIKNWALKHCTGDWVLTFDADEILDDTAPRVRDAIESHPEIDAWDLQGIHYYWHLNRQDASLAEHWWQARLFRNNGVIKYPSGKAHGLPQGARQRGKVSGIVIHHYGYVKNACLDLWRYEMNWDAPEMHTREYLRDWLGSRLFGSFPTSPADPLAHPQIIRDKFHYDRLFGEEEK